MKKLLLLLALMFLSVTPAYAKEPCPSLLCMAGLFQGVGVSNECETPVHDYFSIIKFNKHGGISTSKTSKARGAFLNKCPGSDGWSKKINDKYGSKI